LPFVRIDREVRGLGDAFLADERFGETLTVMRVIEAVAAFHTETVVVRGTIAALGADDLVVRHVIGKQTTHAAVRTHGIDRLVRLDLVGFLRGRQRARGACLHAFTACDARRLAHRVIEVEHDLRVMAAVRVADHVVHLLFAAGAYTARALDAGVEIHRHRRMREVRVPLQTRRESRCAHAQLLGPVQQFVGARFVIHGRRIGLQQFQHHLLRVLHTPAVGDDFHPVLWVAAARRRQHALALDLDDACPAIAVGAITGLVTKVRNLDAVLLRDVDDVLVRKAAHGFAVQFEFDFFSLHDRFIH
jgi:hypothetical protein